jgi:lipopolysaccharide transport system ATP-binding protein
MSTVLEISNLSKLYRLGEIGTGTISQDLERWFKTKVMGQEDPFLKIGESNDRLKKGSADVVFSLRDINFEVKQGEALGIIGKNGAGKSTLLKILSRVTSPTTGKVSIKGRVASLLEVGTGFHPELTGRENIFLNGAILGMCKSEITRKLDEIIDFSGVERYIDTPVKRYSSGMYVRLAFAVAAHLESEILIVDEVLAVGDAEFQKKCLGKMGHITKMEGRTILFVSHNLAAVNQLCQTGLLLNQGIISAHGLVNNVITQYHRLNNFNDTRKFNNKFPENTDILSVEVFNNAELYTEKEVYILIRYRIENKLKGSIVNFIISNSEQNILMSFDTDFNFALLEDRSAGIYESRVVLPAFSLKPGKYSLSVGVGIASSVTLCQHNEALQFEVHSMSENYSFMSYREDRFGIVPKVLNWKTELISLNL